MYEIDPKNYRELEKELKNMKRKVKIHNVAINIADLFYENWGSDFGIFVKNIVKSSDEKMLARTNRVINRSDIPSWGPYNTTNKYTHAKSLTESLKGTLFLRILPAILYERLEIPLESAVNFAQKEIAERLFKQIRYVVPTKEHREIVKESVTESARETGLDISKDEAEKITELVVELGELLHEGLPDTPSNHAKVAEIFKEKRTWEIGKLLLENFPELKEAIEKHSDRITQLADELAEMKKERDKMQKAITSGEFYMEVINRLDGLEREIKELKEILLEIRSKLE